ncbi:unnamed protein product [Didymodactylos carnosus]|uniref:Uncharacterized protein n=1 Tax=Didymodactylos carnosus TaxID=1234261 RepID=A0A8S2MLR3_9BILA|nr:unnamed protein product [Didymodactylos carnosus]CAF3959896.1 unnamed protein product [Didymodactylos carnosus]
MTPQSPWEMPWEEFITPPPLRANIFSRSTSIEPTRLAPNKSSFVTKQDIKYYLDWYLSCECELNIDNPHFYAKDNTEIFVKETAELLAALVQEVDIRHQMEHLSDFLMLAKENYSHFKDLYLSTIEDLMTRQFFIGDPLRIRLHQHNIE